MKFDWNRHMSTRTISNIIVIAAGLLIYFFLLRFSEIQASLSWILSILHPFIVGFAIAYLINIMVMFFEKNIFTMVKKATHRRVYAMLLAYLLSFAIFFFLLFMMIPQLIDSITLFIKQIPSYFDNITALINELAKRFNIETSVYRVVQDNLAQLEDKAPEFLSAVVPQTINITTRAVNIIINFFVAVVVSIYFIATKEKYMAQLKKTTFALFKKERAERWVEITNFTNKTFSGFIAGKLITSLIVGVICFLFMVIFSFPFPLLISVVIGVTNLIPFFGPILGSIPCAFIILIADPGKTIWFLLFILVLQQIEGNIISPKILGESTGISAIWVLFAIVIGGKLMGFVGMLIGVPIFAVLFTLFKEYIEKRLAAKNLPVNSEDYVPDREIRF